MALIEVNGVAITGICSVLPNKVEHNVDLVSHSSKEELERIIASTGIASRRIIDVGQTSLDLAKIATNSLINDINWKKDDIGLLIVVTQTPDFPFPGNAIQLQNELDLSKETLAFDVNLGCSGFVYGLWQVSQLLKGINAGKALLVVGDTTSTQYQAKNRTVALLFGDAVSAIAIEKRVDSKPMIFSLGSDGAGAPYLIQPYGGAKQPSFDADMFMDGTQVFVFTLREVPASISACMKSQGWSVGDLDYVVMHQANEMMLKRLGDKMKLSPEQLVICMKDTGNASSASIPLAMSMALSKALTSKNNKIIFAGFGVGWSWGSVALELEPLKVCSLLDLAITTP